MNILIPMSGRGSRFITSGYNDPKPLIKFFGKTMIEHVLSNLNPDNNFTLCVLRDHFERDPLLFSKLRDQVANLNLVIVDHITRGAAETCLLAKKYINPESPLNAYTPILITLSGIFIVINPEF